MKTTTLRKRKQEEQTVSMIASQSLPTISTTDAVATTTDATVDIILENFDLLQLIVSFVGKKQYRFVAAIHHRFKETYKQTFPNDTATYFNTTTCQHAQMCIDEKDDCHYFGHCRTLSRCLCRSTASNGNMEVIIYLRAKGIFEWDTDTYCTAARYGHLNFLKYGKEDGHPWCGEICVHAAVNGHLHILQYACENVYSKAEEVCKLAALHGNLKFLQYARENGFPWDEETCSYAARGGYLYILQYARENGCPWDKETCLQASINGYLHILKYAHENGCPWDEETYQKAEVSFGRFNIRQYLRDNGCPRYI